MSEGRKKDEFSANVSSSRAMAVIDDPSQSIQNGGTDSPGDVDHLESPALSEAFGDSSFDVVVGDAERL